MDKKSMRERVAAGGIAVFGCFMAVGLSTALEYHGLGSSEAAGWMQAIGAFVAILAGVWMASSSQKAAARLHHAERLADISDANERQIAMLTSVKVLLDQARFLLSEYQEAHIDAVADNQYEGFLKGAGMQELYDILRAIPPHEFDRSEYVETLLGVMRVVRPGGERRNLREFRAFIDTRMEYLRELIEARRSMTGEVRL